MLVLERDPLVDFWREQEVESASEPTSLGWKSDWTHESYDASTLP